jgi:acyl-CoA reductase-like NAD-dependent aldehyde dehydrogenase
MACELEKRDTIQSVNPATLEINADIEVTRPDELPEIVAAAREAQKKWAALDYNKRIQYLAEVNKYVVEYVEEIARTIALDNGKPKFEAINTEVYPVLDMLHFCAVDAGKALANEKLHNSIFPVARIESENVFDPLGVVGIISPWNFPFAIPMTQITAALTAGNAVIFKPSEFTPLVGDLIERIFEYAKLPKGVLTVIQGLGTDLGDPLLDTGLNKVIFTGSVPVGKHLMAKAAETLTPITLELGGKDPFIVLHDADLERASSAAVWGAFVNAGQVCASVERVYVDARVLERFTELVVMKTKKLRVGNGQHPDIDMGPMINERRLATVEAHVADAKAKGAEILTGGGRIESLPGWFYAPTVIAGANHTMDCMTEETFGPMLPIMAFSGDDEAVALANDSKYGLLSSVWSRDYNHARSVADRIEAGTVIINDCLITYGFAQCPWGGVKNSGIGRTHSVQGLLEFVNTKNITTSKGLLNEDIWWYPYSENKYSGMKAGLKSLYCAGLVCKADGIMNVLKSFKLAGGK